MRAWGTLLLVGCTIHVAGPPGPPPPPQQEVVTARAGFVWVKGRWEWQGSAWIWIGGHWERERAPLVVQTTTTTAVPPPHDPQPLERTATGSGTAVIAWGDASSGNQEIYLKQWDGHAWRELGSSAHGGGVSNTPNRDNYAAGIGASATPVVAVDAAGSPVVAWTERTEVNHHPQPGGGQSQISRDEIFVRKWDGAGWIELGGSGHGTGISNSQASGSDRASDPSIAVDRAGRIVVAWQEADLQHDGKLWIAVRRWNGRTWEDLGGSSARLGISGEGSSGHPSLAIDAQDRPVIAWSADERGAGANCRVAVKRWNGSAWEELAGSAGASGISGRGGVSDPALALDARGSVIVSWARSAASGFSARRWDGQAWQALTTDPSSQSCTAGNKFGLAIDAQGAPLVAQHPSGTRGALRVARWTGSTWADVPSPGEGSGTVELATDSGGGVIATWTGTGIRAARWDGRAWKDLGQVTASDKAWWPHVAARRP